MLGDCMNRNCCGYRAVYPEWDPEDRFLALEEVKALLKSRTVKVNGVFSVLSNSNNGCIEFDIGDITIRFTRGFGVWSEKKDVIQMTVELDKGDFGDIVAYEYTLDELESSHKQKKGFCGRDHPSGKDPNLSRPSSSVDDVDPE